MEQIGGVRKRIYTEGPEAGVEVIEVRTGAGLRYEVVPSKGLDISLAEVYGNAISWQSQNGDAHPAYYEAEGTNWLRSASGGLLMTCGLMQVGSPNEDMGERLGLHGRIHHTPARQVTATTEWIGDELEITVSGVVEETSVFGGHLLLRRTIRSRLGHNEIRISDEVTNRGFQPCPHMILYHFNFGFPLMDEQTFIRFPTDRQPRPREPETPLEGYDRWQAPDADYSERVYYHSTEGPVSEVQIINPRFPMLDASAPLQVTLSWRSDALPNLVQWRMPGAGTHVLGLEPANCLVAGRGAERANGTLVTMEPGQSVCYELSINVN
jgi:hypothetical protein